MCRSFGLEFWAPSVWPPGAVGPALGSARLFTDDGHHAPGVPHALVVNLYLLFRLEEQALPALLPPCRARSTQRVPTTALRTATISKANLELTRLGCGAA